MNPNAEYLSEISRYLADENSSEMSYRTAFQNYLTTIFPTDQGFHIQHDQRTIDGNKPDFIVIKDQVPLLYIEVKKVGENLDKIEDSNQAERYFGYTNLIISDYVEFRFFRNGERYNDPISLATLDGKKETIIPCLGQEEYLERTIKDFITEQKEPIKRGSHLAKIMGGKARRIRENILLFIGNDSEKNKSLLQIYDVLKQMLVHDLDHESFADMYAQTLVYGLFVARYHDESLATFSRQEARDLVPASNPFLQHFFDHITGPNFDDRLGFIVDELCEVFQHADTKKLVEKYMGDADPVIHFYEDFLKEYDPEMRKKMGAYYTPLPVVDFIVRSVDHILEKEFGLAQGLADNSKLEDGTHRVQILDPAVGTGTFISRVIRVIYERVVVEQKQKGRWTTYVNRDLLPRLHGFELMMAPYTIAHLKLSLAFKQTGFHYFLKRLGIYLTNALERAEENPETISFGLAQSIAEESKEAAVIKNETPVMVVIGNPPYSVSSSNKGKWIQDQIKVYKEGLSERNIQPLSDDYIKFIRYAEHFIEKNKTGVVAMITNNSFIDGIIHREMRKHLLETFDDIYILDLHGNSKRKETTEDGQKDENVFDIQQGVSINIFVKKTEDKEGLGVIHHAELFGLRKDKYENLESVSFHKVKWNKLENVEPNYFFVPKDFSMHDEYHDGFNLKEVFVESTSGIKTHNDKDLVSFDKFEEENNQRYLYKTFDLRWINYDVNKVERHRYSYMKHMLKENVGLCLMRKPVDGKDLNTVFVTNTLIDINLYGFQSYIFRLYSYDKEGNKSSNLNEEIVEQIENVAGTTEPEDVLDYIYAVLHSPNYREKYKEFLKIDFPRVPYPENKDTFWKLVELGSELREIHLLESPKVNRYITSYPEEGDNVVEKISYSDGDVHINKKQYFGDVPEIAWNFYIGGYQPAQKWLKDRKGRELTNDDIEHYQKIIVALIETDRITKEIDKVISF